MLISANCDDLLQCSIVCFILVIIQSSFGSFFESCTYIDVFGLLCWWVGFILLALAFCRLYLPEIIPEFINIEAYDTDAIYDTSTPMPMPSLCPLCQTFCPSKEHCPLKNWFFPEEKKVAPQAMVKKPEPEPEPIITPITNENENTMPPAISCSISLVRDTHGDAKKNVCVEKIDAVKEYISNLECVKHLHMQSQVTLGRTGEDYVIDDDVYAHVNAAKPDGSVDIMLFSYKKSLCELKQWIDMVYRRQIEERDNELGGRLFYFDEYPCEPPRDCSYRDMAIRRLPPASGGGGVSIPIAANEVEVPRYRWEQANKHLYFTMLPFDTFKSMKNLYGDHLNELREKLQIFTCNEEWYRQRGLPYQMGILMYGAPGTGKSSTIKAIAADTGRHPVSVKLRRYTSQTQLKNLFYTLDLVKCDVDKNDKKLTTYHVRQPKRLYVFEDVDCLSSVVLDRAQQDPAHSAEVEGDGITLSFFLNLLDGILETPGRLIIMTTNYPERLDPALRRPGRIDVEIAFTRCSTKTLAEMISNFYETSVELEDIPSCLERVFTPAEAISVFMKYHKCLATALRELLSIAQERERERERLLSSTVAAPVLIDLEFPLQEENHEKQCQFTDDDFILCSPPPATYLV
jgi:hypothetical protein